MKYILFSLFVLVSVNQQARAQNAKPSRLAIEYRAPTLDGEKKFNGKFSKKTTFVVLSQGDNHAIGNLVDGNIIPRTDLKVIERSGDVLVVEQTISGRTVTFTFNLSDTTNKGITGSFAFSNEDVYEMSAVALAYCTNLDHNPSHACRLSNAGKEKCRRKYGCEF